MSAMNELLGKRSSAVVTDFPMSAPAAQEEVVAVTSEPKEISVERALEIVCREWCFDKAQVHIQEPAYYESTDWNYIRFQCGPLSWVMQNGELEQQYN